MKLQQSLILALIVLFFTACSQGKKEEQAEVTEAKAKKVIAVTNYPIYYFTSRIVGEKAEVIFPMADSGDPAYWDPKPEAIAHMQDADLVLLNGADYEKWLNKVSLGSSSLFNTSEGFKENYIEVENMVTHTHGDEEEHSHAGIDFTLWLDFSQAAQQAEAIAAKLAELMPEDKTTIEENAQTLVAELMALDKEVITIVAGKEEMPLVVSHPVYSYFTRKYGLNVESRHWEPGQMPSDHAWEHFDELLETHPAKWMLWEGTPDQAIVDKLAEKGVSSAVFAPCAGKPDSGDFMSVMQENIERLKKVFGEV
ncbi:metal ABC transporter substrate-binding protein [Flammeovirgaceae bacterium SG7u.111]|nr:metal ABC transporter substrate-binding protein [Flammeovirgaceae bacterium SG7u.132]WPO38399.1 metal ABC transporter substrate-binding protein [Flammeovirgaceae bacterium SG7u.111]